MNTTTQILLSKKGMKELKKDISSLERRLKDAQMQLRELDKTDGHDERLARIEQLTYLDSLESEIADKNLLVSRVKLLPRKRDALKVAIGSVVELIDYSGRMVRYTLVDSLEANPSDGRISIKSPLGQNLLDRKVQDVVEWSAGLRTNSLRLVNIA